VGRTDDAGIDGSSSGLPSLRTFFSWMARSSFTLHGQRQVGYFVQKQVPPAACWKNRRAHCRHR
jgi:hypothetical protein